MTLQPPAGQAWTVRSGGSAQTAPPLPYAVPTTTQMRSRAARRYPHTGRACQPPVARRRPVASRPSLAAQETTLATAGCERRNEGLGGEWLRVAWCGAAKPLAAFGVGRVGAPPAPFLPGLAGVYQTACGTRWPVAPDQPPRQQHHCAARWGCRSAGVDSHARERGRTRRATAGLGGRGDQAARTAACKWGGEGGCSTAEG